MTRDSLRFTSDNMVKLTQTQIILGRLIRKQIEAKNTGERNELMAPHHFMGEVYFYECDGDYFVSYEASARLSTLYSENDGLLYREKVTGRSGAKYYGYRLNDITVAVGNKKLEKIIEIMLPRK